MPLLPLLTLAAGLCAAQPGQQAGTSPVEHVIAKYLGEVRQYKPGNLLEVDIGDKRVKSYDLSSREKLFDIASGVENHAKVDITEYRNPAGKEVVSVRLHH